jgi:hypothetical protein
MSSKPGGTTNNMLSKSKPKHGSPAVRKNPPKTFTAPEISAALIDAFPPTDVEGLVSPGGKRYFY